MDLNRLLTLAGLEDLSEASDKIKKGAFHKWLGKPEDQKITQADIDKGLDSNDPHVRKMAQYAANVREGSETVDTPITEVAEKPHDSDFPEVKKMDAHGPNSDLPKITFGPDANGPANELNLTQVEFNDDTMAANKVRFGRDVEDATKVAVPSDVMKHLDKRIAELKAAIEKYDEKGYDDKSVKSTAVDCLEKIKKHLEAGNVEEYRMAQVYYGTLMSPLMDMLPTQVINFLHSARETKKKEI
jgi:hypothetical protein